MIKLFQRVEMEVTPKLLRNWATQLERKFERASISEEVPCLDFKDYNSKVQLILRGNQEAFHRKDKGDWS